MNNLVFTSFSQKSPPCKSEGAGARGGFYWLGPRTKVDHKLKSYLFSLFALVCFRSRLNFQPIYKPPSPPHSPLPTPHSLPNLDIDRACTTFFYYSIIALNPPPPSQTNCLSTKHQPIKWIYTIIVFFFSFRGGESRKTRTEKGLIENL